MEAALTSPEVALERIPASTLLHIGIHARDTFGRRASQCQTIEWLVDWIIDLDLIEVAWIDPWNPITRFNPDVEFEPPLPIVDLLPLVDVALVAIEKFSERQDAAAMKAVQEGARFGITLARRLVLEQYEEFAATLRKESEHLK
jgi:hypothetical protein